jgi:E3 ubiquitin-protein ligase CCNP1IP1
VDAFREKSKTQQQTQKLYQSLKAQVMASQVATAATDEAENTIYTASRDRFVDRIPGARSDLQKHFNQFNVGDPDGRRHDQQGSGSSGGNEGQVHKTRNSRLGSSWNSQAQNTRNWAARKLPLFREIRFEKGS